ncbi:conserved hypothetical protein [Carnobacterium maltaromaticum]|uniref:DUF4003 family protein n=1 Tax=Carnobacterium maltaromaticum TaxID=2751 RepID=UPI00191BA5AE|nr:DUF4003 family protein [Carnobacterium maltaromaticum]CAD5897765.1 conserved hypothetical protein [Carnobacterium maltaromaticum]
MNQSKQVNLLRENYEVIKSSGVHFIDKRMRYLIARVFTGSAQRIQPELFLHTNLKLKQQSGLFTNLTSTVRASIASLLIANEMNTDRYYHELADNYQLLLDSGFRRSEFTYFAAYQLLHSELQDRKKIVREGKAIFEAIQNNHRFLKGRSSCSMAILIAQFNLDKKATEIAEIVDYYFQELSQIGFRKNEQLYYLAALGTIFYQSQEPIFINQIQCILNQLDEMKIPLKPLCYTTIGILAFIQGDQTKLMNEKELSEFIQEIRLLPGMRFQKEISFALGLSLYTEKLNSNLSSLEMESLLLALQIQIFKENQRVYSAST